MVEQGAISADDGEERAKAAPVRARTTCCARDEPHGQYFKEEVRQALVERFGWQRVYQGGLRVSHDLRSRHCRKPPSGSSTTS